MKKASPRLVKRLHQKCDYLSQRWNASPEKSDLVSFLETRVISSGLFVDGALCLALGTFRLNCEVYRNSKHDDSSLQDVRFDVFHKRYWRRKWQNYQSDREYLWRSKVYHEGQFIQLLVFETILASLRAKFDLGQALLQDPMFDAVDVQFLRDRGHFVIPYEGAPGNLSDQNLHPNLQHLFLKSLLVFAPHLPYKPNIEIICAAKPVVYLGNDPMWMLDRSPASLFDKVVESDQREELQKYVDSCVPFVPFRAMSTSLLPDDRPAFELTWAIKKMFPNFDSGTIGLRSHMA